MNGWKVLSLRLQLAMDKLGWGMSDLRRILTERGLWPGRRYAGVSPDGKSWSVLEGTCWARTDGKPAVALVVPETECFWGETRLPTMLRSALPAAVNETLWRESPLPVDQIAVAWRSEPLPDGGWLVRWGMCRQATLNDLGGALGLPADGRWYFLRQEGAWLVAKGIGGRRRPVLAVLTSLGGGLLLMVSAMALLVPAVVPVALKRQGVVHAMETIGELEPKAAPLRQQLDALRSQTAVMSELRMGLDTAVPHAAVVEALSAGLPDDTWLDRIDINGAEIKIQGMTGNANDLVSRLGKDPAFQDVRSTAPTVRDAVLNKERFIFEMRWRGGAST